MPGCPRPPGPNCSRRAARVLPETADAAAALAVPRELPAPCAISAGGSRNWLRWPIWTRVDDSVVIAAIHGPAGVGKTTLAVYWAHRVADQYPDGQLYLNLRGFDPTRPPMSAAEAVRSLLDSFGVPPQRIPLGEAAQAGLFRSMVADLAGAGRAGQRAGLDPGGPAAAGLTRNPGRRDQSGSADRAGRLR
jgi:hypothetical protein